MTVQHALPPGKYKLTVDDFLRLDETGVFGTDRTELLDGDIIIMNAEYRPHGRIRDELYYRLRRLIEELGGDLYPLGASVALSDHSMPLPDIVLTRALKGEGPIPLDSVAMIIEVSASTLQRDTTDKVAIYAAALVPEYWIVDVSGRTIHQMWSPSGGRYEGHRQVDFGERVASATIDGVVIATDGL